MCIAHDPGVRLRDIAASLDITERSACGIVTGLTATGYGVKQKDAAATGIRSRHTSDVEGVVAGFYVPPVPADVPVREPPSADVEVDAYRLGRRYLDRSERCELPQCRGPRCAPASRPDPSRRSTRHISRNS